LGRLLLPTKIAKWHIVHSKISGRLPLTRLVMQVWARKKAWQEGGVILIVADGDYSAAAEEPQRETSILINGARQPLGSKR
jgi:hypothetical protein